MYGPNKKTDGQIFFESFFQALNSDVPVILGGDFNTAVDPRIDRLGCNPDFPWAYNWSVALENLMSTYNLKDCWRSKYPLTKEFTWKRPDGAQASRLDMFWVPEELLPEVQNVSILPFFRSDHSYVYLEINLPNTMKRGPGVWKFNTSHLADNDFRTMVTTFWHS